VRGAKGQGAELQKQIEELSALVSVLEERVEAADADGEMEMVVVEEDVVREAGGRLREEARRVRHERLMREEDDARVLEERRGYVADLRVRERVLSVCGVLG
jgi:hypothetical protein